MYSTASSVYSTNHQARALCPQRASTEKSRFITGTCSLHEENEIHVLEYRDGANQIDAVAVYDVPENRAVWSVDASSSDPSRIITCDYTKDQLFHYITAWKMPGQTKDEIDSYDPATGYNRDRQSLEELVRFNGSDNSIQQISWNKKKESSVLLTSTSSVSLWSITDSDAKLNNKLGAEDAISVSQISSWCHGVSNWDPHNSSLSASAFNKSLQIIDWRKLEVTLTIPNAHSSTIRDIDFNPNKPSMLVTCGDDRKVKFWDMRNLGEPVKTLSGHTHWVWATKFNPFHDQLIISGGSDNLVNLWRIASCSSAPVIDDPENPTNSDDPIDVKVRAMDQHEDSVYGLAWSPADAWVYASLSYDGRVVLNHVPSTEKYKILL